MEWDEEDGKAIMPRGSEDVMHDTNDGYERGEHDEKSIQLKHGSTWWENKPDTCGASG
jgi:hypothetical protein